MKKRNIKDGSEYDHLFEPATGKLFTVKKNATLEDTMTFIPKCVQSTLAQTKKLARLLKGKTVYDTCSNTWYFVYNHINYKKDREGFEQVRSPARAWHDRRQGVDCDCYSVFISSILTNLDIPHILRITRYKAGYQHIYPIVPTANGEITIDCVTDQFDYEVPFTGKKDYPMDLQLLSGFDDKPTLYGEPNDLYLLGAGDGMEELGKVIKRNMARSKKQGAFATTKRSRKKAMKAAAPVSNGSSGSNGSNAYAAPAPKKKKGLKKFLNKINKFNPATVLLRNGILASMKLNIKNVAKRLRWSYATPEQAAKQAIDPGKFQRLVATRQKLENIFYGAGGKPDNLKKAILKGKGNKDKAVMSGLGMLELEGIDYMDTNTPLPQLLGPEIYISENVEGFEGLGQLGEPVTLASVAAAAGVVAGIVASLKQIGDIFLKKGKGSEDFKEDTNEAAENNAPVKDTTPVPSAANNSSARNPDDSYDELPPPSSRNEIQKKSAYQTSVTQGQRSVPSPITNDAEFPGEEEKNTVPSSSSAAVSKSASSSNDASADNETKETFWDKNKKWIKPVAIGAGGIAVIAIGYSLLKSKKQVEKPHSLSGFPKNKKGKKKNHHRHRKKTAVAML